MASGGDEVEAAVDSGVRDSLLAGDVHLLLQELLVLLVDELRDGLPAAENTGPRKESKHCRKTPVSKRLTEPSKKESKTGERFMG